jgi:hypothetical protein
MRHITPEEAQDIFNASRSYPNQSEAGAMMFAFNAFIDRYNADKAKRKASKRNPKYQHSGTMSHAASMVKLKGECGVPGQEWVELKSIFTKPIDAKGGVVTIDLKTEAASFSPVAFSLTEEDVRGIMSPNRHPLTTDANLYRSEPVKLADFLKSHYDAERGVFDFETPDGAYVFFKGKE